MAIADRILNLPVVRAKAKQLGVDLPEPSNASGSRASSAVQAPENHQGVPARSLVSAYEYEMHATQLQASRPLISSHMLLHSAYSSSSVFR